MKRRYRLAFFAALAGCSAPREGAAPDPIAPAAPSPTATGDSPPPVPKAPSADPKTLSARLLRGVLELRVVDAATDEPAAPDAPPAANRTSSCVLVSADGHAVTNAHAVAGASELVAVTHDGDRHGARVVAADPDTDIAVLEISGDLSAQNALEWASELPATGAAVYVVGNALGAGLAVSRGMVADRGRTDLGHAKYEDYVMIDVPVARGVSGGAVSDANGALIGVAVGSLDDGRSGAVFGLAISNRLARAVVDQLISTGRAERRELGLVPESLDAPTSRRLGLTTVFGARVAGLDPSGPAAAAGMQVDDVVVRAGDWEIRTRGNLMAWAATAPAEASMTVLRGGQRVPVSLSPAQPSPE